MKNDFEYIKNKFDEDGIKAPDSLSEENIMALLSESQPETEATAAQAEAASAASGASSPVYAKRRTRALRFAALAACALIAIVGIPRLYYSDIFLPDTTAAGGELYTFESRSEIERIIKSLNRENPFDRFRLKSSEFALESETAVAEESDAAYGTGADTGVLTGGSDHSNTYLQVEDVDEADIVKVDGRYIYAVSNTQEVIIYEATDGKVKKLSTIGSNGIENYISDIFLKGDMLVTIGHVYDDEGGYASVVTYDITDRSKPTLIDQFRQSGQDIISSRMVGDFVYLVTTTYAYDSIIVPKCSIDGDYKELPATDISCVPNPRTSSYTILSAVDVSTGSKGRSKTKAVFGSSQRIYCNNHNLYVAVDEYSDDYSEMKTRILRASLDGLNIKFNSTATVNGYINDQFSMDEYNGCFRIATTSHRNGIDVNNLYILDEKLKEVGKIAGFARDESIKAVRFMGDRAYVITYEAIDPLFIMDLSDPANPRIDGEVKIDGFSSLLVPAAPGKLLGIGHATGDNGYGGQYASGLKLALFDTSNPSEPKVLDSIEFKNMDSPAQNTHLALTVNEKYGYYAIPYSVRNYGEVFIEEIDQNKDPEYEDGVLVFGIEDGKIVIYDRHSLEAQELTRSVYIGDYIYGITGRAEVSSFKFTK